VQTDEEVMEHTTKRCVEDMEQMLAALKKYGKRGMCKNAHPARRMVLLG